MPELRGILPGQQVTVRVPATSANLGPGFDSLGLALSLYDTLTVETLPGQQLEFQLSGEGADVLPRDASHLVVRVMELAFARLGLARAGLRITADNVLPHGRGLGSSAAAIVAAIVAANALAPEERRQDRNWVLQLASEVEGHPDNVAPALYGAVAISWQDGSGYRSVKVLPDAAVIPVVAVPAFALSTETARSMLPASVSHAAAAANSGRAALLIHALKEDPSLLLAGTEDYLHQQYRAEAMSASAALMAALRAAGLAAFISGAGPTVMTLAADEEQAAQAVALIGSVSAGETAASSSGASWRVLRLTIDTEGAKVEAYRR